MPWWPGSVVSESGVRVHHPAFGIGAMMGAGVVSFAVRRGLVVRGLCACVRNRHRPHDRRFALWICLDDVYWAREPRSMRR
jgi:hypothetical protein